MPKNSKKLEELSLYIYILFDTRSIAGCTWKHISFKEEYVEDQEFEFCSISSIDQKRCLHVENESGRSFPRKHLNFKAGVSKCTGEILV